MKAVDGRPCAPDAQGDVWGGGPEERSIDMGLELCGRRGAVVHAQIQGTQATHPALPDSPRTPMAYSQPHPRLSVLSNSSQSSVDQFSPTSSAHFSIPPPPSIHSALGSVKPAPGPRPNIYDRNLNKTRTSEVSASAFAFLFAEIVQYTQKRVGGINDLERRYLASLPFSHVLMSISGSTP